MAQYAVSSGHRKIGILYREDSSGMAFREVFKQRVLELGAEVIYEQSHALNEADFRPQILRLNAQPDVDLLFAASYGPEVAVFLRQARSLASEVPVLGFTTCFQASFLDAAGSTAEGVAFSAPAFDPSSTAPGVVQLRRKLKEKFGHERVTYYTASHYDAAMILLKLIAQGARDGQTLRGSLSAMRSYPGISGKITFTGNGASSIPLRMYTIRDGKFTALAD